MKPAILLLLAVSLCGCAARAKVTVNANQCRVISVDGCSTDSSGAIHCTTTKLKCATYGVSK